MKKTRKLITILAILFLCTGCWEYREVEDLLVVTAISIEKKEDQYFVCLELFNGKKDEAESMQSIVYTSEGPTPSVAFATITKTLGKALIWTHAHALIIDESIAKEEGVKNVIDWLSRNVQPRLNLNVFISQDVLPSEILQIKNESMDLIGLNIYQQLLLYQEYYEALKDCTLYDLYYHYNQESNFDVTLPIITIDESVNEEEQSLKIVGTALFRDIYMVESLDIDETLYLSLILNQSNNGHLYLPMKDGSTKVVAHITGSAPKKNESKIDVDEEPYTYRLNVAFSVDIEEILMPEDEEFSTDEYEKEINQYVLDKITATIEKIMQSGSDPIGISRMIYFKDPDLWRTIQDEWEYVYQDIQLDIDVDIVVASSLIIETTTKGGTPDND